MRKLPTYLWLSTYVTIGVTKRDTHDLNMGSVAACSIGEPLGGFLTTYDVA
jgi:hypothetical protein